jgi:hypothetical protein
MVCSYRKTLADGESGKSISPLLMASTAINLLYVLTGIIIGQMPLNWQVIFKPFF